MLEAHRAAIVAIRAAWDERDVGPFDAAISDEVILRSPIVTKPFEGRDAVVELPRVLLAELPEMQML